jgi:lysophospholipase L1-like esterase
MSGTPHQVEGFAPFDFAGTLNSGLARPYDSSQLSDGLHEITALIELTGGGIEMVSAVFSLGPFQCPAINLFKPESYDLISGPDLKAIAIACANSIDFPGWGVRFHLTGGIMNEDMVLNDLEYPFEVIFNNLANGEYTVTAMLIQSTGDSIPGATEDQGMPVGLGDYYVAFGDSITEGFGDDYFLDDMSLDGRNLGGGYEPILNDLLTAVKGYPHTVENEGVGGEESIDGLARIQNVIDAHPEAQYFLILFGTNDSHGTMPVPSGWLDSENRLLNPGETGYTGTFLDNMQQILDAVFGAGKQPVLAKVPIALGPCSNCTPFPDPENAPRNLLIREYNRVIQELVALNGIAIAPPDFYGYFSASPDETYDNLHPDGVGYQQMANLWLNVLTAE